MNGPARGPGSARSGTDPADVARAAPAATFRCRECRGALGLVSEREEWFECTNPQCSAAGLPVALWRAQRAGARRGDDVPAPGAGWPRPVLDGLPHPWLTPVSDGKPWWRLLDDARQARAQDGWLCQVCGEPLPTAALVVLNDDRVVSDTALHPRCLTVAREVCPHLTRAGTRYAVVEVTRGDLLADGDPLPLASSNTVENDDVLWVPAWTVRAEAVPSGLRRLGSPLS